MNDIIMWVIIGVVAVALLAFIIYFVVKIVRLSPEERKQQLLIYLKGLVAMAEKEIGSGHGAEKLKDVEDYFHAHASWFLKVLLLLLGKDSLKDLIEQALSEVKKSFEK